MGSPTARYMTLETMAPFERRSLRQVARRDQEQPRALTPLPGARSPAASLRDFYSGAYTHYFAAYRLYGNRCEAPDKGSQCRSSRS